MAEAVAAWRERVVPYLRQLPKRIRALEGWRRLAAAVMCGALAALAQAPFLFWPLLFVTLPPVVWMVDSTLRSARPLREAALIGWAFGFGYFLIGLHWVGYAFFVDADAHAWMVPFVAVLLPGGLALFYALAFALARQFWSNGWRRIAVLAASLSVLEWLRGHVLTGFPWNLFGYVWVGSDAMIQPASVIGIYGLSLITLIAAAAPAAVRQADGRSADLRWPLAVAAGLVVASFAFGAVRLPAGAAPTTDVALRIVQPNVPQDEKWKDELFQRNWQILVDLTQRPGLESRTHIVWPEAAPPLILPEHPEALAIIGQMLGDDQTLLTGTVRRVVDGERRQFFNSMAVVDGSGAIRATYDKAHLVPFGEYLPFQSLMDSLGITKITGGNGGYSEGPGVKRLTLPKGPSVGPLICYEVIFPAGVVERGARPGWLANLTDDSWFGPWTGPYQHLGIARVRAAEEGLPIVRAANTGVSAIIDPFGRIVASLGLNQTGVVDGALPQALSPTLYSRFGDLFFAIICLLTALTGVIPRGDSREGC